VSKYPKRNAGATFMRQQEDRDTYDANGDNFLELPQQKTTHFWYQLLLPTKEKTKLESKY